MTRIIQIIDVNLLLIKYIREGLAREAAPLIQIIKYISGRLIASVSSKIVLLYNLFHHVASRIPQRHKERFHVRNTRPCPKYCDR